MMTQLEIASLGAGLLAVALGLPYMAVMKKQGWSACWTVLGAVALFVGIALLVTVPYMGA